MNEDKPETKTSEDEVVPDLWGPLRMAAWLPWLPLFVIGIYLTTSVQGYYAEPIFFTLYALISWPIGIALCVKFREDHIGLALAFTILILGPMIGWWVREAKENLRIVQMAAAREKLEALCEEKAGTAVSRIVRNVEGIYRISSNLEASSASPERREVTGSWIDRQEREYDLGFGMLFSQRVPGYYFVENLSKEDGNETTYLRTVTQHLTPLTSNISSYRQSDEKHQSFSKTVTTKALLSEYGWQMHDLTTMDMRASQISGGKIEIIHLQSGVPIASHIGFALDNPVSGNVFTSRSTNSSYMESCDQSLRITEFLLKILRPSKSAPTDTRLNELLEGLQQEEIKTN